METYHQGLRREYNLTGNTLNNYLTVRDHSLYYKDINLHALALRYKTPLEVGYVDMIRERISDLNGFFNTAIAKHKYQGNFIYAYATKASQYAEVVETSLSAGASMETTSQHDIEIAKLMIEHGRLGNEQLLINNGFKYGKYIDNILALRENFPNVIPIIEKMDEISLLAKSPRPLKVGVRLKIYNLAKNFSELDNVVYRFGFHYKEIKLACEKITQHPNLSLQMFHALVGTQIEDEEAFLRSLFFVAEIYCDLAKQFPSLEYLNIGGGLPVPYSLSFSFNYERFCDRLIAGLKEIFDKNGVKHPKIIGEYGRYTVAEESFMITKVIHREKIFDKNFWYYIDHSLMTSLPDIWALNHPFIVLPLNLWNRPSVSTVIGGLTCDSDDYFPYTPLELDSQNLRSHHDQMSVPMPWYQEGEDLYLGFFSTGAYQEILSGIGGVHHCLVSEAAELLITPNRATHDGYKFQYKAYEQSAKKVLRTLDYDKFMLENTTAENMKT